MEHKHLNDPWSQAPTQTNCKDLLACTFMKHLERPFKPKFADNELQHLHSNISTFADFRSFLKLLFISFETDQSP